MPNFYGPVLKIDINSALRDVHIVWFKIEEEMYTVAFLNDEIPFKLIKMLKLSTIEFNKFMMLAGNEKFYFKSRDSSNDNEL